MSMTFYAFIDRNIAGQEWRWTFDLERMPNGTLSLSAQHEFIDGDEDDEPLDIEPRIGIPDGADIYEAFGDMLGEAGIDIEMVGLAPIAERIAKIDHKVATDFRNGAQILEMRFEAEANRQDHLRAVKLMPHVPAIEAYCSGLSDERTRGGGGISRPSVRTRVRAYMEEYAVEHGRLPKGPHRWQLGNGFLSGEHNFGVPQPERQDHGTMYKERWQRAAAEKRAKEAAERGED